MIRTLSRVAPLALGLALMATPASAGAGVSNRPFLPANHGAVLPLRNATVTSLNWSGYAVAAEPTAPITAVHASFTVPKVSDVTPGFAATWTGIGGFTGTDLIQAGVGENSPSGLIGYFAWYELIPDGETPLTGCAGDANCTVLPGDQMSIAITQVSADQWTIVMNDASRWSYNKTVTYSSSRTSAEWILEAPQFAGVQTVLPMMQTVHFGSGDSFTAGGSPQTIAAGQPVKISLLGIEANPSPLRDGSSFDVCVYSLGCP
jgi:hypothetical protein